LALKIEEEIKAIAEEYGVSIAELEAATLAKYSRRAAGHKKDILAERQAILEAVSRV
jgi:hypothetical protein